MDSFDIDNINYNELYKLHTGHAVYDSDTDSSNSKSSSSSCEENKPPLYTYEELKANSVVIQSIQSESGLNLIGSDWAGKASETGGSGYDFENHKIGTSHKKKVDQYIKERLGKSKKVDEDAWESGSIQSSFSSSKASTSSDWATNSGKILIKPVANKSPEEKRQEILKEPMLPNYCSLCNAYLPNPNNAFSHYNSTRHKNNVRDWTVAEKSPEEERQEKLKELMHPNFCYVCFANLPHPNNALSHYNSTRHKNNVSEWKVTEKSPKEEWQEKLKELMLPNYCCLCNADLPHPNNAFSHYNSPRHKNNVREWKDNPLYELLLKKLGSLICSDYCYICYTNLTQVADAQSHYNSKRHKNNLDVWISTEKRLQPPKIDPVIPKRVELVQQNPIPNQSNKTDTEKIQKTAAANQNGGFNTVQNVKPYVDSLCVVCGIKYVVTELQDHRKSDLHQRCAEAFCFVCNIKTMSKEQLAEHVKGIWHKNNLEMKGKDVDNLTIPRVIVNPGIRKDESSNKGSLILNTEHGSQRKVEKSETVAQVIPKLVPLRWCYCDLCKVALNGTEAAESHYKEPSHILKDMSFYCHICKLTFGSKTEIDVHVKCFPHNELAKLSSLVVSKGLSTQEFWKLRNREIWCSLCRVCIQSVSSAASHLGSKRHCVNFNSWCSEQSKDKKDPNRRWYFCDICNKCLDGTTNIELHYQGFNHATQYKKHLSDQKMTASSEPIDIAKEETKDGGEMCDSATKECENKNETSNPKCEDNDSKKVVDINANRFYCFACRIQFSSQSEVNLHAKSFPHSYVAELKSLVVSQGIAQEFWINKQVAVWCSLCEAYLQDGWTARAHFQSSRHVYKLNNWYQGQRKDTQNPNRKWHYCDICNKSLDGTTNAEVHYQRHSTRQNNTNNWQAATASISTDETPKLKNADLNIEVANTNEISADNGNKKQEETKENGEKAKLKTEMSNNKGLIDDEASIFIGERSKLKNADLNIEVANTNETSADNGNKKQEETKENSEKAKLKNEMSNTTSLIEDEASISIGEKSKLKNADLNIKVANTNEISAHNGNKKHQETKENSEKAKLKNENNEMSNNKSLNNDEKSIYCYICKKQFNSQMGLNFHIQTYPHNYIAKLKSLAVSKGIFTQFWIDNKLSIWCALCEVSLLSRVSANEHFAWKRHVDNFDRWCREQPKEIKNNETKWYFCDICNESLDGTSNAERHYQGTTHAKNHKKFTDILQSSTTSRPSNIVETDSASVSNSQFSSQADIDTIKNDNNLKTPEEIIKIENDGEHSQKMVYSEMARLKTVVESIPPNTALTFLRKFNKELENYKRKPEHSIINTEYVISTRKGRTDVLKNNSITKHKSKHSTSHEYYVQPNNQNYKAKPSASNYYISNLLTLGTAGILFLYIFRK